MNWEQFLLEHSIEYVTSGPNTKRGEVSVQCPFCGSEDPSQHMGINLSREAWGCHRNAEHRGKSPLRLIQGLLGCTMPQARLTLAQYSVSDPDSLEGALAMLNADDGPAEAEVPVVQFPPEFREIQPGDRFWNYLQSRGYWYPSYTSRVFGLKCAISGRYKDRLIFPIHGPQGLLGWTGRAIIDPVEAPRYLASSANVKQTCYGYEHVKKNSNMLFIVEGPFDALRINSMNYKGARAIALMGTSVTVPQLCIIRQLMRFSKYTYIYLDGDAWGPAVQLHDMLGNARLVHPARHEDPDSMDPEHMKVLIDSIIH